MKEYFTKSSSLVKDVLKQTEKDGQLTYKQSGGNSLSHPDYLAYKAYKKYKQKYKQLKIG